MYISTLLYALYYILRSFHLPQCLTGFCSNSKVVLIYFSSLERSGLESLRLNVCLREPISKVERQVKFIFLLLAFIRMGQLRVLTGNEEERERIQSTAENSASVGMKAPQVL